MRAPLAAWIALCAVSVATAQHINIDFGQPGTGPATTYGAAGLAGLWNSIEGEHTTPSQSPQAHDYALRDVYGLTTAVGMHQFGGLALIDDPDPVLTDADDAIFLQDGLITFNPSLDSCLYFNGLIPGTYEVTTYAWRPNHPEVVSESFIDNTPGVLLTSGAWPGAHAEGVTYVRHMVTVNNNGFMGPHSGLPVEGNTMWGSVLNGMQLRLMCPDDNDGCAGGAALSGNTVSVPFNTACTLSGSEGADHACGTIDFDLWYSYTATCTGDLLVGTESGCAFDTAIALYDADTNCVPTADELAACDDVGAACESVSMAVTEGQNVLIRVGSTAGEYGSGVLDIQCLGENACTGLSDCADADDDGIRDDNCMWHECAANECGGADIVFADMGGQFGACAPDGAADGNDRFHALNCFANVDANQNPGYPCETGSPAALNVDAGGPFGDCNPDGVCDGNDAFHALNAFADTSPCSCPLDGSPSPEFELPLVNHARLVARAQPATVQAGDFVEVDILLGTDLEDLRGYQLHVTADGGHTGHLELIDILIRTPQRSKSRRQARTVPALDVEWSSFNVDTRQMVAGRDNPGQTVDAGDYLATFVFRASKDAAGTFAVDIMNPTDGANYRSYLFPSGATDVILITETTPALIEIE